MHWPPRCAPGCLGHHLDFESLKSFPLKICNDALQVGMKAYLLQFYFSVNFNYVSACVFVGVGMLASFMSM